MAPAGAPQLGQFDATDAERRAVANKTGGPEERTANCKSASCHFALRSSVPTKSQP